MFFQVFNLSKKFGITLFCSIQMTTQLAQFHTTVNINDWQSRGYFDVMIFNPFQMIHSTVIAFLFR